MAKTYKKPNPVTMADYQSVSDAMASAMQKQLDARIPNARGLEESSSTQIANLLRPPAFFSDQDRRAAELGASRGIPGAAAAYSGGLVMNADEQLKRIALGQQMLTAADARNPVAALPDAAMFNISPFQKAQLDLERYKINEAIAAGKQPSVYSQGMPSLGSVKQESKPIYTPGPSSYGDPFGNYYGTFGVSPYQGTNFSGANIHSPGSSYLFEGPPNPSSFDFTNYLNGLGVNAPIDSVGTGYEQNVDYGEYTGYGE